MVKSIIDLAHFMHTSFFINNCMDYLKSAVIKISLNEFNQQGIDEFVVYYMPIVLCFIIDS